MSLQNLLLQSLTFLLIAGIVYLLSRALKIQPERFPFAEPKRAALSAVLALWVGWILVAVLFILLSKGTGVGHGSTSEREFGPTDLLNQLLITLLAFGPALLAIRLRREPKESAGIRGDNLTKALLVGVVLVLLTLGSLFFSGVDLDAAIAELGPSHVWAFAVYLLVGFSEEFAFRGYLQTRLVAWLGTGWGWVLASVIMAFAHIIQRMTMMDMTFSGAFLSSASLVPVSLLMGYIMLRTGNIAAPGLFHTMLDWINTLG